MPLSTARASAPTAVVSVLTEIHPNPPLTFLNYPHRIASSDLPTLSPTSFTSPLNPTLPRTTRGSRMQNPYLPRARRASGFVQIFQSQVLRRETLGSPRKLTASALVDRKLRFFINYPLEPPPTPSLSLTYLFRRRRILLQWLAKPSRTTASSRSSAEVEWVWCIRRRILNLDASSP